MNSTAEKAKALYLRALEKNPIEWAEFLSRACDNDEQLRELADKLLQAHQDTDLFGHDTSAEHTNTLEINVGDSIGPYRLYEELGEGGMGIVYLAEHQSMRRPVALKMIKAGMDTRQVLARFETERQILAMLDHPSIAKVFDAGMTRTGRPYFVMELVRGVPITKYCDDHELPVAARLELLSHVCDAVHHAHNSGIIHRDLKPSNIQVTPSDKQSIVKLVDFGVAKSIGQQLTDKTMFTQLGQIVGTLEYMSPEQARVNQLDVDTRSDIYSLGVLLYELLTGATPFDRERLHTVALDEMMRIIREEDPPIPSVRLSTEGDKLTIIAKHRSVDPKRLRQMVRGELDWIAMKALRKDRANRYETVSSLSDDLQRYLRHEPVEAHPYSVSYRLRQFARCNSAKSRIAAAIVFATAAGLVGFLIGLMIATK